MKQHPSLVFQLLLILLCWNLHKASATLFTSTSPPFLISTLNSTSTPILLRGPNIPHAWYPQHTQSTLSALPSLNANAARIVLTTSTTPADVQRVIQWARDSRILLVLENHDTTGYGDSGAFGTKSLPEVVPWWTSLRSILQGTESFVILNLGNEPQGNSKSGYEWVQSSESALQSIRRAGFRDHVVMLDAPNWGQDWRNTMRDNAEYLLRSDQSEIGNSNKLMFSVHMYGVYNTPQKVNSYISSFVSKGVPLVIGEFGYTHSDGDVDEQTIFQTSQSQQWNDDCNHDGILDDCIKFNGEPDADIFGGTFILFKATRVFFGVYNGSLHTFDTISHVVNQT
ncbi:hypothetical protein HDV05_002896 [Chytridiales sp. JEL 0842]|nr:hypothetical protein HDV05_002896 [Chytridiales sp. JEL 0842]